ncbi:conserved hypothetical protein [Solidesulfovibrio fructosivorans JJ]]|uniref:N-acetyltransferase domain-containing protein n=1 Tax=Solidesulfovibrio fructosivorans JJ] TaxID=596151 RepID=E1JSN7_SOLFR|nr:hypothetical protein [Solidesulfovibrio fructosivorans]EFL52520.1 conserved hypothetical protein [Solidesulfovibrio fructosivorans JJ]]
MPDSDLVVSRAAGPADMDAFIRYAWEIYRDDPLWVPPLIPMQEEFLDPARGPFFEFGQAEYFLARRNGRVVGRISAHVSGLYEKYHDNETGFFGFFECENNRETAHALFDAAAGWVRAKGKVRLHGPLSFAIYDEVGLLVDGFDTPPAMMQTHNPRYYEDLVTSWGFTKTFDWYAYRISRKPMHDAEKLAKLRDSILKRQKCTIQPIPRKEFAKRGPQIKELFNDIWSKNWGHIPLTDRQYQDLFVTLQPLVRPDLETMIVDDEDNIVAFSVVSPDMNRPVKRFNGKFGWWQKLQLVWDCRVKPLTHCRAVIMGVARSHQWKRLHHAIILNIVVNFLQNHPKMEYCDCSLIPESLEQWNKTLMDYGGERYKVFRLYDRDI